MRTPLDIARRSSGAPWSALLDVTGPGGHRTSLPFRAPCVRVGRQRTNDLALPDQGVSSSHCEFVLEGGFFVVRDLASINGTYVNDRRISEARLRDGDVVRLGATKITVALQGTLRGDPSWRERRGPPGWLWPAALALIALAAGGFFLWQKSAQQEEQKLRQRYALEVRGLLQFDPCVAVAPRISNLGVLDERIAGRPVPMASPGRSLSPALQQQGAELLGLYRAKEAESAQALQSLAEEQRLERESFDKALKLGKQLHGAQDRKIAAFAQAQLAERQRTGESLQESLSLYAQETQRFAGLVEAVSLHGDAARTPELLAFRFAAQSPPEQLARCKSELERANAGVLGALNGIAEE